MAESEKVFTRGWLAMLIGAALLIGGLVALCFPVFLDSYDKYGVQIKCGNGYHAELLQATIDDQEPASAAVRPTTSYVDQCNSALAHRRAWLIPVAALGVLILIPDLVAWARGRSPRGPVSINAWSATPDDMLMRDMSMHSAALLDRRDYSRRKPSTDTTV